VIEVRSAVIKTRPIRERQRLLVVEDDAATRLLLGQVLMNAGYEVFTAQDGQHALRSASALQPDLIVLDLGLPVLDGAAFVQAWRARTSHPAPIVAVSGRPEAPRVAKEIGLNACIAKPFDADVLVAEVRRQIESATASM